jgi:hypothetical protein
MNLKKVIDSFIEFESAESNIKLFDYGKTNSWTHVKFLLFLQLTSPEKLINKTKRKISFRNALYLVYYFLKPKNKNKSILYFGTTRGLTKYNNEIIDLYSFNLNIQPSDTFYSFTLNNFSDLKEFKKFFTSKTVYFDNIFDLFYKKIFRFNTKGNELKNINSIVAHFKKFGFDISENFIQNSHKSFIISYIYNIKKISRFKDIKQAFIVSSHTKSYILAALKEYKIHCTEVQHGFFGPNHITSLYSQKNINHLIPTPDKILVYNDFWKKDLENIQFSKNIETFNYFKYSNVQDLSDDFNGNYIIYTDQGVGNTEIVQFIDHSIETLIHHNIKLIIKPHPTDRENINVLIDKYKDSPTIIFYTENLSTETLIVNSIGHFSLFSACHFDAVSLIGKTYVLSLEEENMLSYYIHKYPSKFILLKNIDQIIKDAKN